MYTFTAILEKFDKKGEKSGWAYIAIPAEIATKLLAENKKSFRIKGKLDDYDLQQAALLPMGEGNYILPVNATLRKKLGKKKGSTIKIAIEKDDSPFTFNEDFLACLEDEPAALDFFNTLNKSHQRYFSKWIDSAKTVPTKEKRILMSVKALSKSLGFPEMIHVNKLRRL